MGMKQKSQQDLEVQLKIDREKERIYPTKGEKTVKIKKEEEEAKGTWSPVFVGWVYEGNRLKCKATARCYNSIHSHTLHGWMSILYFEMTFQEALSDPIFSLNPQSCHNQDPMHRPFQP